MAAAYGPCEVSVDVDGAYWLEVDGADYSIARVALGGGSAERVGGGSATAVFEYAAASSCRVSGLRAVRTTRLPRSRSWRASSRPNPLEQPVIIQTHFFAESAGGVIVPSPRSDA